MTVLSSASALQLNAPEEEVPGNEASKNSSLNLQKKI